MSHMNTSINTSWVEKTVKLCDQVLQQAANIYPTNLALNEVANKLKEGLLA
jgi:hypothetical protein